MPYTVQEAQAVSSRLQQRDEEYAKYLGELLATAANICESADGLEMAAGMHSDRNGFYADAIQSICEQLQTTLHRCLSPEQLNWYFAPDTFKVEE